MGCVDSFCHRFSRFFKPSESSKGKNLVPIHIVQGNFFEKNRITIWQGDSLYNIAKSLLGRVSDNELRKETEGYLAEMNITYVYQHNASFHFVMQADASKGNVKEEKVIFPGQFIGLLWIRVQAPQLVIGEEREAVETYIKDMTEHSHCHQVRVLRKF